jgi:anhydro-N-acetylmuramic acid kinase
MSGTSLDGVDGVLVGFDTPEPARFRVLGHAHRPFEPRLAAELLALNTAGADELHRGALAANALARLYASVVLALREAAGVSVKQVRAIGAHGQTVRHRPGEFDGTGYTVQLNNPALLAELIGIDVIADLRSRDLAAGGQGAPLVPAFHRAVFGHVGESLAVLNLGGMGNLTALRADGSTTGFDCGPGNTLLDLWCLRHTGRPFDDHGAWAASGCVDPVLLAAMQLEPFFAMPPPKSTGRDLFNAGWLDRLVAGSASTPEAVDVQATLVELTTAVCVDAVNRHAADTDTLLVCGGGALNDHLMQRLAAHLPAITVQSTAIRGLPPCEVEACAFAWLARAFVHREPANLPSATGAAGLRILGALYPAG